MMTPIYHIVSSAAWMRAHNDGVYYADSLESEGFIHFSLAEQVVQVANAFYTGQTDLLLLVVDPERLEAELRFEPPDGMPGNSERFPHLYGALNLDAVQRAVPFPPNADGTWSALPMLNES